METEILRFDERSGWSCGNSFPDLDSPNTLVTVFASSCFGDRCEPIDELRSAYPSSVLSGASTAGEIVGTEVNDQSIAVAVARFERSRVASSHARVSAANESFDAGRSLAREIAGEGLKSVFVLSEGICVNGTELVRGINSVLANNAVVTGGLAGDGDRFEKTWVLEDGFPRGARVSAVALYGESLHVGHGSKGGWDIFGPQRVITRSNGNRLYEIDGQPALSLYKSYLGDRARELPASALLFPLSIRACDDGRWLVRTVLSVDESDQSMIFAGDIPEGQTAQLMRANFDRLIDGAGDAALMATPAQGGDTLALAISCVGRRIVLGERAEEEVEATYDVLPEGTKQVGFYSYGELSPHVVGSACELHNQTMTLTTIVEG